MPKIIVRYNATAKPQIFNKNSLFDERYFDNNLLKSQVTCLPKIFKKQSFIGDLQNSSSQKYYKIHKKTSVLGSLFNKVADIQHTTLLKKRFCHRSFHKILHDFEEHLFYGTPPCDYFYFCYCRVSCYSYLF